MANKEQLDTLEGEREIIDVNSETRSRMARGLFAVFAIMVVLMASAVGYVKFGRTPTDVAKDDERKVLTANTVPARTFVDIKPEPVLKPAKPVKAEPIVPVIIPVKPKPVEKQINQVVIPPPPLDRAGSAGTIGGGGDKLTDPGVIRVAQGSTADGNVGTLLGNGPTGGNDGLGDRLKPTKLTASSAALLGDSSLILAKGSYIDCALNNKLESTVPGIATCILTHDVLSKNGEVVLMERGSLVSGEYRSNLRQGSRRIFLLWNRVATPGDVVIDLDSPATDGLGATGVPGHIDTHFWQRFGAALMLSLVDDAARAITSTETDNAQINFNGAANVTSDLAAEVLRNTINIPPTLYANQGARVGIYVARDLDFSTVYELQ